MFELGSYCAAAGEELRKLDVMKDLEDWGYGFISKKWQDMI